ncbi:hypothetical protein L2E82_49826 [Cichorium intybus]|uniref:Uncharacterized protein n=1 Tax=Cichorium intybus TaxID=13427 RepID=A0ACB8Z268_CICIN|nr:hypothetical protein L2E82_49826 [Cichorium intybus]
MCWVAIPCSCCAAIACDMGSQEESPVGSSQSPIGSIQSPIGSPIGSSQSPIGTTQGGEDSNQGTSTNSAPEGVADTFNEAEDVVEKANEEFQKLEEFVKHLFKEYQSSNPSTKSDNAGGGSSSFDVGLSSGHRDGFKKLLSEIASITSTHDESGGN